jgi:NAD(P)-dependent dehydrogenase (short-subunit alcohol dehydrogenase family)
MSVTRNGTRRVRGPELDGRVAVITGAGSGFGRACAFLFAGNGARVVVADINADRAQRAAEEIRAAGGSAIAVACDVSDETAVQDLVGLAVGEYGTLDIMFNNAGIAHNAPFEEITAPQLRRLFDVNVMGVFFGCKHAIPVMKAKRSGVILNTSSAGTFAAVPQTVAYAASKGAVNILTRDLAVELGPFNIRVNALCSMGGMSANLVLPPDAPLVDEDVLNENCDPAQSMYVLAGPRPPRLADHANVALFLASDDAAWCSGICMPIDGATTNKAAIDVSRKLASYTRAAGPS